jgi:hypothetical protein
MPSRFTHVDRYTCPACGLMTLREELVRHRVFDVLVGGAPTPTTSPSSPSFGLITTLRPTGILGDQSDMASVDGFKVHGLIAVPATAVDLSDLVVEPQQIDYLLFYAHVGYSGGVDILQPQAWVSWNTSSGGQDGEAFLLTGGIDEIYSLQQPTNPNTEGWDSATIATLQMRCGFFCDDNGSGETTTCKVYELWAEVWGVS